MCDTKAVLWELQFIIFHHYFHWIEGGGIGNDYYGDESIGLDIASYEVFDYYLYYSSVIDGGGIGIVN